MVRARLEEPAVLQVCNPRRGSVAPRPRMYDGVESVGADRWIGIE